MKNKNGLLAQDFLHKYFWLKCVQMESNFSIFFPIKYILS